MYITSKNILYPAISHFKIDVIIALKKFLINV